MDLNNEYTLYDVNKLVNLIKKNINDHINLTDKNGTTALMIEIIKLLIDSNKNFVMNHTDLMYALRYSIINRNIESIKLLIERYNCVDLADNREWTVLMYAYYYTNSDSNIEIIKLLIDAKADVDLHNYDGNTALMIVAMYSSTDSNIETI